jgi:hypothetical protein
MDNDVGFAPLRSASLRYALLRFAVTYTTLGFGDVKPANLIGEVIVSSEVILGYTTLGLLLSVLAQNIARRS